MSFKKAGISMVALVITIIVLIILTVAVVITGVNAPKQAQLAVFYSNIDTVQDLVNLTMANNIIEGALNDCDNNCKWVNIVEGYSFNNGTLQEPANAFTRTSVGIGENIEPIKRSLLDKTTLADGEKSKYYVGESGKVYYAGFEYEGNTYYNKDKNVPGIDKPIDVEAVPPAEPTVITVENVKTEPLKYYGVKVQYMNGSQTFKALDGETDLEWRIFYAEGDNIYITTSRTVNLEATTLNILNIYYDGVDTRDLVVEALLANDGRYVNNTYADGTKTSDGITYEMFKSSYNNVRRNNVPHDLSVNANGAVSYASNSISRLEGTPQEDLYVWQYDEELGDVYNGYWLASPSEGDTNGLMFVLNDVDNTIGEISSADWNVFCFGLRPLVCLKSDVQLVASGVVDANGYMTYNIM